MRSVGQRLVVARRDELAELLNLQPYAYEDPEEALEELTEKEILESEPLLEALLAEAYGDGTKPDFELCRTCLSGYRRIGSPGAADVALDLLEKLPSLTNEVIRYLLAIDEKLDAKSVVARVIKLLFSADVIHPWQRHWLLRLLSNQIFRAEISSTNAKRIFGIGIDRNEHWAVRAQAIRLMAGLGEELYCRKLKGLYPEESNPDVKHAILLAVARLPGPEKTGVFRMAMGGDAVTDLLISSL